MAEEEHRRKAEVTIRMEIESDHPLIDDDLDEIVSNMDYDLSFDENGMKIAYTEIVERTIWDD